MMNTTTSQPQVIPEPVTSDNCMYNIFYCLQSFPGFDIIITNLSFLCKLFAVLLVKIIDYLSKTGNIITINPADWFVRTCTLREKYHDVLEYIRDHVCGYLLIEMKTANKLFNISGQTDQGIFVISKSKVADRRYPFPKMIKSIVDKATAMREKYGSLHSHCRRGCAELYDNCVVLNDMYAHKKWFKLAETSNNINPKTLQSRNVLQFASPEDKERYIQNQNGKIACKLAYLVTHDQHTQPTILPYLGDFQSDDEIIAKAAFDREQTAYLSRDIVDPSKRDYIRYAVELDDDGSIVFDESNIDLPDTVTKATTDIVRKHTIIIYSFAPKSLLSQNWQISLRRHLSFGTSPYYALDKPQVSTGFAYSNKHGPGLWMGKSTHPLIRGKPSSSALNSNLRA